MTNHQTQNLKIAVTGHRYIPDNVTLHQSIREILVNFLKTHPDHTFALLSPLAEGSDQLAARIAIDLKPFQLQVPLPMEVDEYLRGFNSKDSQAAFHQLLALADKVYQLPHQENHKDAYHALGQYLIHNSDMLLAIWNGVHTKEVGGTSDVVRIASAAHKPIYWVYCPNLKPGETNNLQGLKQIGDLEIL